MSECYYRKRGGSFKSQMIEAIKSLAEQLNIAPLVATLLVNRGINDLEKAKEFLFTEDQDFHDPFY